MNDYDDDGQVDGDFAPPVPQGGAYPLARAFGDQPWLRSAIPPWHLWGNSQRVDVELTTGAFGQAQRSQLTKVSYGRPETWGWLFTARLISGALSPPVGTDLQLTIIWELTVGIGRSMQQSLGFDVWNIIILGGAAPPIGRLMWANQVVVPSNLGRFNAAGVVDPTPPPNVFNEINAQDIQLNARVAILLSGVQAGYPYNAALELGAQWAPKAHVRPDWYLDGPTELRFPGSETGAK
jgi:hypothetical protein